MQQPQGITNWFDRNTSFYYGWVNILCSSIGNMFAIGAVIIFSFSTFIGPITGEFGWSRGAISGALTLLHVCILVSLPGMGILIDKYGARSVLIPCTAIFGVAVCMLYFINDSIIAYYAIFALFGLAASGTLPITYSKIIVDWFDSKRGLALGLGLVGVGLGAAILPKTAQYFIQNYGWREAYLAMGLAILLFVLPMLYLFMREKPADGENASAGAPQALSAASTGFTFKEAMAMPAFYKLLVVFLFFGAASSSALAHYVPMLIDSGIPRNSAISIVSTVGISLIIGRVAAGYLMDKFFAPFVAALFFFGPVCGFALLSMGVTPTVGLIGAILIGAAMGAEFDVVPFFISRYFGRRAFGKLFAAMFGMFLLGSAFGPLLMGISHDVTQSYSLGMLVSAITMLVSVIVVLTLGPYSRIERATVAA